MIIMVINVVGNFNISLVIWYNPFLVSNNWFGLFLFLFWFMCLNFGMSFWVVFVLLLCYVKICVWTSCSYFS